MAGTLVAEVEGSVDGLPDFDIPISAGAKAGILVNFTKDAAGRATATY